mmetsp:Transcript_10821/g.22825  ORF Transcript_10821/g.22825 Transcript_10821/m.22825 type:complete len:208 (-) Transcript_10821:1488-2111(-)
MPSFRLAQLRTRGAEQPQGAGLLRNGHKGRTARRRPQHGLPRTQDLDNAALVDTGGEAAQAQPLHASSKATVLDVTWHLPGLLLWHREVLIDAGQRDELHLGTSGMVKVGLDHGLEHEEVRQAEPQGAGAHVAHIQNAHDVGGRRVKTPEEIDAAHQPPSQYSLAVERCLELVVHGIAHPKGHPLLVSISTDDRVIAAHISDEGVGV